MNCMNSPISNHKKNLSKYIKLKLIIRNQQPYEIRILYKCINNFVELLKYAHDAFTSGNDS